MAPCRRAVAPPVRVLSTRGVLFDVKYKSGLTPRSFRELIERAYRAVPEGRTLFRYIRGPGKLLSGSRTRRGNSRGAQEYQ
jgi:hypothetical protein